MGRAIYITSDEMKITIKKIEIDIDEATVNKFVAIVKKAVAPNKKHGKGNQGPKPIKQHREVFLKHLQDFTVNKFPESSGYTAIAEYFNSVNFPTVRGCTWSANSVRQILLADPSLIPDGLIIQKRGN